MKLLFSGLAVLMMLVTNASSTDDSNKACSEAFVHRGMVSGGDLTYPKYYTAKFDGALYNVPRNYWQHTGTGCFLDVGLLFMEFWVSDGVAPENTAVLKGTRRPEETRPRDQGDAVIQFSMKKTGDRPRPEQMLKNLLRGFDKQKVLIENTSDYKSYRGLGPFIYFFRATSKYESIFRCSERVCSGDVQFQEHDWRADVIMDRGSIEHLELIENHVSRLLAEWKVE